ncbi:MAG: NapC/NirT family cytochrome c [Candidatus Latescibacterota bacterium]
MAARRLPDSAYNWVTAAGAFLAGITFSVILILLLLDLLVVETSIYLGLLTYVALPVLLIAGLLIIPLGMGLESKRLARGQASSFPRHFHVDLVDPGHRNAFLIFVVGSAILLVATSIGTYKAYQQTESVAFCGQLCHSVMSPEYTAYRASPHARVACVECHIGSGADWYAKSKLSGAYQVYATLANVYPRPIPTPIEDLRPARETCEECHWPTKFFGSHQRVNPHFLPDEANTPYPISLLVKVGGGSGRGRQAEGIHWHVSEDTRVEYIARDPARLQIAWVRLTGPEGRTVEYALPTDPLTDAERAAAQVRTMDCMDCHNRPSHQYRSPNRTVNEAMAQGLLDPSLPFIKAQAVQALDQPYADTPAALRAIEEKITAFFRQEYPGLLPARSQDVARAVAAVQGIYRQNSFPEMKVTWRQYPDHVGHTEFVGCFRCHGSALESTDGQTISRDCSLCHLILRQGTGEQRQRLSPAGLLFQHPEDVGDVVGEGHCTDCHEGGAETL